MLALIIFKMKVIHCKNKDEGRGELGYAGSLKCVHKVK